jgi:hypothetical protein
MDGIEVAPLLPRLAGDHHRLSQRDRRGPCDVVWQHGDVLDLREA